MEDASEMARLPLKKQPRLVPATQGVVCKQVERKQFPVNPSIRLIEVVVPPPDNTHTLGDLERLTAALAQSSGLEPDVGIEVLASLQAKLRANGWRVTCVIRLGDQRRNPELIDIWPGTTAPVACGIAVDIGSTTIMAYLCDLATGDVLAAAEIVNPQVTYGADVMTRVSHSMMHPGTHLDMTAAVRDGVRQLVGHLTANCGVPADHVLDATVVCNPIMHHLYLGFDPVELGQAPFTFATSNALRVAARDVGLPIHARAQVYLLPAVGNHVGADAAAVLLSETPEASKALSLIVDIGTNAEIFLGNASGIVASSSPTGPALEGAEITHGQRAAPGAIETVRIDPVSKRIRFRVIGSEVWSDDPAFAASISDIGVTGICGSGVIELVAEMRMAGLIDQTGRIGSPEETGCAQCFLDGRTYSVSLYDAANICFTNNDVREVQMAKAALYASIRLLMDESAVQTVDRIVLAGAFGSHISPKHAIVLGLIPDCAFDKVTAVGNAAGSGACMALLDVSARHRIEGAVRTIRNIETATHPSFQKYFLNASDIPNAADPFPCLATHLALPDLDFRKRSSRQRTRHQAS
ncbi:ASKHA domain-containing protein [Roseovarius sp. ZX-A-9]|uniref:ASKHA domain-containing protein n=1 Tax=Roseovarius sp. ZX-A-9 TaxID=3014783 RepID=UPI002330A6FC|nr:ASKHA domain-containing protein [Roseovarius sp. ZX-A-9]